MGRALTQNTTCPPVLLPNRSFPTIQTRWKPRLYSSQCRSQALRSGDDERLWTVDGDPNSKGMLQSLCSRYAVAMQFRYANERPDQTDRVGAVGVSKLEDTGIVERHQLTARWRWVRAESRGREMNEGRKNWVDRRVERICNRQRRCQEGPCAGLLIKLEAATYDPFLDKRSKCGFEVVFQTDGVGATAVSGVEEWEVGGGGWLVGLSGSGVGMDGKWRGNGEFILSTKLCRCSQSFGNSHSIHDF